MTADVTGTPSRPAAPVARPIAGTPFTDRSFEPIVVTTRSGVSETLHHGAGVVVAADGAIERSIGDVELAIYPRSALKPLQATAMVGMGLELPDHLLAVACASHSGESRHLAAVQEILQRYGFGTADLDNTPGHPLGADARERAVIDGIAPSSLQQNCSGKHAAMLATCRINGWDVASYRSEDHPLQVAISAEIDRFAGRPGGSVQHVGVDGCGAPAHLMPLVDVARAFGALMRDGRPVVDAMAAEPGFAGGEGRDVTIWMEAVPGLIAKEGAAGVIALALPDGRAAAAKIADGSDQARQTVTVEMLRTLGVDVDDELGDVRRSTEVAVLGHGAPVGVYAALSWPDG